MPPKTTWNGNQHPPKRSSRPPTAGFSWQNQSHREILPLVSLSLSFGSWTYLEGCSVERGGAPKRGALWVSVSPKHRSCWLFSQVLTNPSPLTSTVHWGKNRDSFGQQRPREKGALLACMSFRILEQRCEGTWARVTSNLSPIQFWCSTCPGSYDFWFLCPRFVPMIGFKGSSQFVWNLSEMCQIYCHSPNLDELLTHSSPPDWNPDKQSLEQIVDKFGARGTSECCKGSERSQVCPWCLLTLLLHDKAALSRVVWRKLSAPLDRLNAILSLLQPLDRYRTPAAKGSAIGAHLSRPISLPRTGRSPQPPRSKPLRGLNRAIVAL